MKEMKAEWISVFLARKTARAKAGGWCAPGMMKGNTGAMGAGAEGTRAGEWATRQQVTSAQSDTPVGLQEAGLWLFLFVE